MLDALNAISLPPSNAAAAGALAAGHRPRRRPGRDGKIIPRRRRRAGRCAWRSTARTARAWCWKLNYDVFYGEGADSACQNFEFQGMRLPDNLFHFLRYVTDGKVEAVDGRLRLKEEYETFGCYEPRQGRDRRPHTRASGSRAATAEPASDQWTRARGDAPGLRVRRRASRSRSVHRSRAAGAARPAPARRRAAPTPTARALRRR